MQRYFKILAAMAIIALVSTTGSVAMAHGGGGGGHGGGGGRSFSGGSSRGTTNQVARNPTQNVNHNTTNKVVHPRGPKPGNGKNGRGRRPGRRPRYHMHYPVEFWFDGDFED